VQLLSEAFFYVTCV